MLRIHLDLGQLCESCPRNLLPVHTSLRAEVDVQLPFLAVGIENPMENRLVISQVNN